MTEMVYVRGKCKWFKHITPDKYLDKETWKHTLYPDPESLEKIRDLQSQGMKNVLKKDEDGFFITFSRPVKMMNRGKLVPMDPPYVIMANGKTQWVDMVGNGSDITTKLEVYSHNTPGGGKAKAARWLSSRIDNLVPYESAKAKALFDPDEHFTPQEQRAAKDLDKQPLQVESPF